MQDKVAAHHHPLTTVPSILSHPIPPYPEAGHSHPSSQSINQFIRFWPLTLSVIISCSCSYVSLLALVLLTVYPSEIIIFQPLLAYLNNHYFPFPSTVPYTDRPGTLGNLPPNLDQSLRTYYLLV